MRERVGHRRHHAFSCTHSFSLSSLLTYVLEPTISFEKSSQPIARASLVNRIDKHWVITRAEAPAAVGAHRAPRRPFVSIGLTRPSARAGRRLQPLPVLIKHVGGPCQSD